MSPDSLARIGDDKLMEQISTMLARFAAFVQADVALAPYEPPRRRRRKPPATEGEAVQ